MAGVDLNLSTYLPNSYFDSQGNLAVSDSTATTVAGAVQSAASALPPADQATFLDLVQMDGTELAPTGGQPPADLDAALGRLASASTSLDSFLASAVDSTAFAKALIELASSEETGALQNRLDAINQAQADYAQQATDETNAADAMRTGAIVSLVLGVTSACLSIAAGGVSIAGASKALSALKELEPEEGDEGIGGAGASGSDNADDVDDANSSAEETVEMTPFEEQAEVESIKATQGLFQGVSGVLSGLGEMAKASGDFGGGWMQAQSKTDDAQASQAAGEAEGENAHEAIYEKIQQSLSDLISSLQQYIGTVITATSDMMHSITQG